MKKLSIISISILIAIGSFAQESAKKTNVSFRTGLGTMVSYPSEMYVEFGMDAEHRFNDHFSMYAQASLYYAVNFYDGANNYSMYALTVGPRYYPGKKFFLGIGSGIISTPWRGERVTQFNMNPHIGFDSRKMQVLIGQTLAFDDTYAFGFTSVTLSFKLNGSKK